MQRHIAIEFCNFFTGGSGDALLVKVLEEGQNQTKIAQKRIKFEEIVEEKSDDDRISGLPNCLLLEILSRLPSITYAIRTGTLSKRWKHLWTLVPTLIFTPPSQCFRNPNLESEFALLVDKTLTQCPRLKRKKFEVHTFYDIRFESHFNDWIRYAISCNVEHVNLEFVGRKPKFLLDQDVFINSCFTNLRLAGCQLNPTGAISWENLRSLYISEVIIDEDLLVNIVSGSPLLETLVLQFCRWPNINSDDEYKSETDDISASTSLSLAQCHQLEHLKLFKLHTSYDIKFQSQLKNWIQYAIRCNVEELHLRFWNKGCEDDFVFDQIVFTSSCFIELKLDGCMVNPVGAISWKNLRSLCIFEYQSLDEDLIENILSGTPVLETLVLEDCYGYRRLDITSKSVKNLELCVYKVPYGESEADIIKINAPSILSLSIRVDPFLCKPLLLNVSSLVKAYLGYTCFTLEHCHTTPTEAEQEMLKGCIVKLHLVKELELGVSSSKVLSCLQAKGSISPSNVKLNIAW